MAEEEAVHVAIRGGGPLDCVTQNRAVALLTFFFSRRF